jgi:hypothetical protein
MPVAEFPERRFPPPWNVEELALNVRRFPPPWTVEETAACFVLRDANGETLAYVYCEEAAAKLLSKDEAYHCGVYLRRHRKPKEGSSC